MSTTTNLSASAYLDLRNYIQSTYLYVEITDSSDAQITRLQIGGSDGRAVWSHTTGANPMQLTITLKGSDSDIPNPSTIGGLYLHETSSDTTRKNESVALTVFTIQSTSDELTITAQIALPATLTSKTITSDMVGQTVTIVG